MVFDNFEQRVYDTQPQTCRKTKRWCVVINRHRFSKPSVLQHKLHEPTVKKLEVFTWWSLFLIEIAVLSRESSPVWRKNNSRSINWRVLPMMNKYNDLSSRSSAIPVFGWPWLVSLLIFCFVTIKCRGHIFFFKEKKKLEPVHIVFTIIWQPLFLTAMHEYMQVCWTYMYIRYKPKEKITPSNLFFSIVN